MHVHVDQAGQQRLASGLDRVGAQRLGVGRGTREDFGNLAVLDQHGALIDYGAIAQEQARIADQSGAAALDVAAQNLRFGDIGLGVHLPGAQDDERTQHGQQPELRGGSQLLFLLPAEQLRREQGPEKSRQRERARRGQIIEDRFLAAQDRLQARC